MKRIRKGPEPRELAAWRASVGHGSPLPPWGEFGGSARAAVRARTSADQENLCCYCTASIANGAFHLEHFRPRKDFERLTYAWSNLLASCESDRGQMIEGTTVETQRHCGEAKGDWFDEGVTIDPQARDVEPLFRFPLSGKIAASKSLDEARFAHVEETIARLNLNAPSLVLRRRNILARAAADAIRMTRDEWHSHYIAPRWDRSSQEFWPALKYNYDKLWSSRFM